jgi:hypothetical protein
MSGDRLKYDRGWIERLQQLPCYRSVVDKLLQRWSLDAVTNWIMEQPDRGPLTHLKRSTIRTYLNALNIRLREIAHESGKFERTLRAQRLNRIAEEFTAGLTQGTDGAVQQPELTEEEKRASQEQHLKSMVDELTSDRLVRFMLKIHFTHVARLEEFEQTSKEPAHTWERSMDVMIDAAAILQKNEAAQQLFEAQKPIAIPEPQLSKEEKRISQFSAVDQNIIREVGQKALILRKRYLADGHSEDEFRELIQSLGRKSRDA